MNEAHLLSVFHAAVARAEVESPHALQRGKEAFAAGMHAWLDATARAARGRVHDVRADELAKAREQGRHHGHHRSGVAAMVFDLTDAQLVQALHNVGVYVDTCDACAEVFFTGSKMHDHTCPKGR